MNKLLTTILGLLVSLNVSATTVTCFIGTDHQVSVSGIVVLASQNTYRVQTDDFGVHYLPTSQCVVDGIVLSPTYIIEEN